VYYPVGKIIQTTIVRHPTHRALFTELFDEYTPLVRQVEHENLNLLGVPVEPVRTFALSDRSKFGDDRPTA
jgi:hypothetical protein